jgi:hypothetical protein
VTEGELIMIDRLRSMAWRFRGAAVALAAALHLLGATLPPAALAQTSSGGEAPPTAPMEQRALDLLRRMSDRLAGASGFSVWARGYREIPATTGHLLTFANTTEVVVRRPDRMRAEVTGDLNVRFWYDGASIAVLDAGKRFYARADAPPRVDEMLSFAVDRYGVHFPSL